MGASRGTRKIAARGWGVGKIKQILAAGLCLLAAGCASMVAPDSAAQNDPLEPVNRLVFSLNQTLDKRAALPAAQLYASTVPNPLRQSVHNVLSNLGLPVTMGNDILQGRFDGASETFGRFAINTTLGIGGLFDFATDWGLPVSNEDFGQTLGVYGVGEGPYLVLPLIGPDPPRDLAGAYVDSFLSPLGYVHFTGRTYVSMTRSILGTVDTRSRSLVTYGDIERASVDSYATQRSLYRARRNAAIRNGGADIQGLPEF